MLHKNINTNHIFSNLLLEYFDSNDCNSYYTKLFYTKYLTSWPIPVAERFKAKVCDRQLAGIVGSHPTGCMDVCVL